MKELKATLSPYLADPAVMIALVNVDGVCAGAVFKHGDVGGMHAALNTLASVATVALGEPVIVTASGAELARAGIEVT